MARIAVQMGHVGRTPGSGLSLGAAGEQAYLLELGPRIVDALDARGHDAVLVHAVTGVPGSYRGPGGPLPAGPGDLFVALHCDGSTNPNVRGGSVGYPDEAGRVAAHAWKLAHQRRGWNVGYRPDNYTPALRGYYGFGLARSWRHRFVAEHGFISSPDDRELLYDRLESFALAHVDAVEAVLGAHPTTPTQETDTMLVMPSWGRRQANGRRPFFALVDISDHACTVIATGGAPYKPGLDKLAPPNPAMTYGAFGLLSTLRIEGLAGRPVGIGEDGTGVVAVGCADGGTVDIAVKPG